MNQCYFFILLFSLTSLSLADNSKAKLYQRHCYNCHHGNLQPPHVPPMYVIQKEYKKVSANKKAFIDKIADYVAMPMEEKALITLVVNDFGVMPSLSFKHESITQIADYIYDAKFELPCAYWQNTLKYQDISGNAEKIDDAKKQFKQLCH